jgi:arsenite methyltransferase
MKTDPDVVREAVREHYAAEAKSASCCGGSAQSKAGSSCCDPAASKLYPVELLTDVPEDLSSFSLGCGDPISLANLQPGETVLDLGSGGGLDCFLAARKVGSAGQVIGVDMTPEMIERARAAAGRLKLANVEFRQGFLEELPVEDNTVDVTISNCVINLAPDKAKVFAEVFRVLKPGGKLAVSDIVTEGPLPDAIRTSLSAWAGCIAGALDIGEYRTAMLAAGFSDISVEPTYFDDATIDEAIHDMGDQAGVKDWDRKTISRSVFSARISARKPQPE